jgi:hypothetical protein
MICGEPLNKRRAGEAMFTLEIDSRPIATTDAEEPQARDIFESDEFRQDLTVMTSEGTPLWDGQAPLTIRPASEQEVAAFAAPELDVDDDDEDEDDGDGVFVTFLVPIDHNHEEISAVAPSWHRS